MTSRSRNSWILLVLGLAFALRVVGLPDLQLSGDAAWSVYLALKDLPALTLATAMDSHPPLFYYVLHAWIAASGLTELAVRFPSAVFGLLTVTLTYKLGKRLLGPWGGLIAGLLAAVSPFLVYFDRMPRMYSLMALLAALALYLVLRLLVWGQVGGEQAPTPPPEGKNVRGTPPNPRPGGAGDVGELGIPPNPRPGGASDVGELGTPPNPLLTLYLVIVLAALYTHYYTVMIMASGFLVLAVGWRRKPAWLLGLASGHLLLVVLYLPWVFFVAGPSVTATSQGYGSIGLARPSNIPALLERFWIALNVGDMGEVDQSRLLTLALSALWAAGLVFILLRWKQRVRTKADLLLIVPAIYVVLPLAAIALVFNYTPFIPFTRLLLFSTPAYLVLMAWMLRELGRASRLGALAGAALALAIPVYALAGTYYVERHSADFEAVEVTRRLKSAGGADDAIIFQALWHAGYFRTHSGEASPSTLVLGEVPVWELPRILGWRNRLWLSMFASAKRDSNYPQEEWLDANSYKAEEWWQGNLRLSLYGGRPDPPLEQINADFGGLVQLEAAGVAPGQARPGDVLRLFLRWRALRDPGRKLVVFVHLVDADGRGCNSRDSEPVDGLRPTENWKAGEVVDDRRGLVVGPGTPAGLYYLAVGLYAREEWRQRVVVQGTPEDRVLIGPIEVLPPSKRPLQFGPVAALPEAGLEIVEYELDTRRERRVIRNVDGPVDVWTVASLRPGSRAPISLRWRAGGPVNEAYRLVLEMVDSSGRAWGRSGDGLVGGICPSFRWVPDEVVTETRHIAIQADAPPGKYRLRATIYPQQGDKPLGEPMVFGTLDLAGK